MGRHLSLDYPQVVRHRENPGDAVGVNSNKIFVALTIDHPFKRYPPIFDNDADGLLHA